MLITVPLALANARALVVLLLPLGRAKLKIALAKGKKQHDKRASIRQREWDRDQHRLMKLNR